MFVSSFARDQGPTIRRLAASLAASGGQPGLQELTTVVTRFPERELEIRRRARDPGFCDVCRDYEEAMAALRYWQAPGHADVAKADEYRRLAAEFEAEILAILNGPPECRPPRDEG